MGAGCAFAIKQDGTMWSWGANTYTKLGYPGPGKSSPTQIGTDSNWSTVYCTETSCAAIKTNNQLWVWGRNQKGELGRGNLAQPPGPRQFTTSLKYFTEVDISGETLGAIT